MRKIIGVIVLFCILASCKTSKASCDAYGNTEKINKSGVDLTRNLGGDSSYNTKK